MKRLLIIILLLFQTSCGFVPAYKAQNAADLSFIEITPISSIEGTYFYNHLKALLPPSKDTKYVLTSTLAFSQSYNIIQANADILRETQNISVSYQLIDKNSLQIVTSGNFTKMNSYSVNFSLYSNTALRQDSTNLLAENAAEEVRNRLMLFFVSKRKN